MPVQTFTRVHATDKIEQNKDPPYIYRHSSHKNREQKTNKQNGDIPWDIRIAFLSFCFISQRSSVNSSPPRSSPLHPLSSYCCITAPTSASCSHSPWINTFFS